MPVCEWLLEVGPAEEIQLPDDNGCTPMYVAASNGHLSVCKWLFEVGAAADITKASNGGTTPMCIACQ